MAIAIRIRTSFCCLRFVQEPWLMRLRSPWNEDLPSGNTLHFDNVDDVNDGDIVEGISNVVGRCSNVLIV